MLVHVEETIVFYFFCFYMYMMVAILGVIDLKFKFHQVNANVTTLALGLQPRRRLVKVLTKSETGNHISCS